MIIFRRQIISSQVQCAKQKSALVRRKDHVSLILTELEKKWELFKLEQHKEDDGADEGKWLTAHDLRAEWRLLVLARLLGNLGQLVSLIEAPHERGNEEQGLDTHDNDVFDVGTVRLREELVAVNVNRCGSKSGDDQAEEDARDVVGHDGSVAELVSRPGRAILQLGEDHEEVEHSGELHKNHADDVAKVSAVTFVIYERADAHNGTDEAEDLAPEASNLELLHSFNIIHSCTLAEKDGVYRPAEQRKDTQSRVEHERMNANVRQSVYVLDDVFGRHWLEEAEPSERRVQQIVPVSRIIFVEHRRDDGGLGLRLRILLLLTLIVLILRLFFVSFSASSLICHIYS